LCVVVLRVCLITQNTLYAYSGRQSIVMVRTA